MKVYKDLPQVKKNSHIRLEKLQMLYYPECVIIQYTV